jgi:rhodanese-related sulfurtransferase
MPGSDPDLSPADLMAGLSNGSLALIDVREAHEFAAGHIPGSQNMPLSSFDPYELPSEKQVVLSCQAGKRSTIALDRAIGVGKNNCRQFLPGFAGWLRAGLSVETQ